MKTSIASMTSTDMITSLASMTLMTSTASLASKNQKQHVLYILREFPGIRNLIGLYYLNSLNNFSGLNDLFSLKTIDELEISFPSSLEPKSDLLLLLWDGSSKIHYFFDFCNLFFWRLRRTEILLLTKSKDHK